MSSFTKTFQEPEKYLVIFKSKQSYYDLLSLGGLSWHKTQKSNPKKDEVLVLEKREEIKKNWIQKGKQLKRRVNCFISR